MRWSALLFLALGCQLGPSEKNRGPEPESDCEPAAVLTADRAAGHVPLTVAFEGASACGGDWAAAWDFGDGETADGAAVAHTWLGSGAYTVTLTLTSGQKTLSTSTTVTVDPAECPEAEDPVQVGTVGNDELIEASGLAEGIANPGVLWAHNDSGDGPRLFALDPDGTNRGTFLLDGAPGGDWEDLAIGEDAAGSPVLYVGDIGANDAPRDTLTIYVVPEPSVAAEPYNVIVTDWWSFDLAFPGGAPALDANTLLWDPATGDLYLAANEGDGVTGIYRAVAPFSADDVVPLERVAGFTFGQGELEGAAAATGGAISPLGDKLAIRTGDHAWVWRRDRTTGMDAAWASEPCPLPVAEEVRGEALAFSQDGAGYYTVSEEPHQPIWFTRILPADPPCDGLTPGIVVTADSYAIPAEVGFTIDTSCLTNGIASVGWDFGDGETSAEHAPTHTYLGSGTFRVTLTVVDDTGATATAVETVEIVPAECPTPGESVQWGTVANDDITEASGLGQSALNPGVVWTHNDSSDTPRLFALSEAGGQLGEYTVATENSDWEDIALGWDETFGAPAIYVGDFGDNGESRDHVAVLVVPEPTIDIARVPITEEITDFAELTLLYPDGAHNAETLMCDPVTGDLYVVTKDPTGTSAVFRKPAPHVGGTTTTLEHVADLTFGVDPLPGSPRTTAGDFSPLGDRIAVRTYDHAWMWRRDQSATVADAFAGVPCDLGAPDEPQGEALAFTRDGTGYLTLSEGEHQPIWFTPLQ